MTNAEIINNTATVNTEKKMTLAEKIAAKAAAKYAEANENREVVREIRKENFQNNTSVYVVVTNTTGYYGFVGTTPAEEDITDPIVRKSVFKDGTRMSTQMAAVAGVSFAIDHGMNNFADRKKISVYVQDSEVKRLGGFINKVKAGSNEIFTEGEINFISKVRGYGQKYAEAATKAYQMINLAHKNGYTLQFISLAAISNIDTVRIIDSKNLKLPMSASFRNGTAIVNGKEISTKERINGSYELIDANGRVAIKRKLNEEQELAQSMKSLVDATLKDIAAKDALGSFDEESVA